MNWGSDWFLCMFTTVKIEFRDVGFTKKKNKKKKKKKVLYIKCISVEVPFESRSYERSLVIFFSSHLFGVRLGSLVGVFTEREPKRVHNGKLRS